MQPAPATLLSTVIQMLPLLMTLGGGALWVLNRAKHHAAMERLRAEAEPGAKLWASLTDDEKPAIRAYYAGAGLILGGVALTTYLLFF